MLSKIVDSQTSLNGNTSTKTRNKLVLASSGVDICDSSRKNKFSKLTTSGLATSG